MQWCETGQVRDKRLGSHKTLAATKYFCSTASNAEILRERQGTKLFIRPLLRAHQYIECCKNHLHCHCIDKWFFFRKCDVLPGQLDWYSWNRRFANCPISPIPCWQFSISTSASSITYLFKAWYHQINPSINQIRKRFIIKNKLAKLRRCATRVVSFRSKKSNQPTPVTNSLTKSEPPCSPPYLPPCPPN